MKYKIGDKLKVKKGYENKCGSYNSDYHDLITHIEIIDIISFSDELVYKYNIMNGDNKIDWCHSCFTDENLEPLELAQETSVTIKKVKPTMEVVSPEVRKWTDDDTTYTNETVTFSGAVYTREEWDQFYKKVTKVNKRFK